MDRDKNLFHGWHRVDNSYARHNEDWFTFLDRVDDVCFARVRSLLNNWFVELPKDKARTTRAELTSRKPAKVDAAFWELYLHAAFLRTPLDVPLEQVTSSTGSNVDFVLSPPGGDPLFSVDAVAVGDPPAARARARRLKAAWDALNQETASEFFVWIVRVEREGKNTPSGTRLRKEIIPWLATLDRATVLRDTSSGASRSTLPECLIDVDDWRFLVRAVPLSDNAAARSDTRRRLVGVEPIETAWGGSAAAVLGGLRRKAAAKYDSLNLPYVVALVDLHRFSSGEDVLMDTLYGDDAVQVVFRGDEIVSTQGIRKPNGFWQPSKNTRVSAVLYVRHLYPWSITRIVPELWVNPWASRPLEARLPWTTRVIVQGDGTLAHKPASISPAQLFGLPRDWPSPEAAFDRASRGK